jgi:hypothetical protein
MTVQLQSRQFARCAWPNVYFRGEPKAHCIATYVPVTFSDGSGVRTGMLIGIALK